MNLSRWTNPAKNPETKSKAFIFFMCLVFSFLAWLSIKLSKETITTFPVTLQITNLPDSIIFNQQTDSVIAISLQTTGVRLFSNPFFKRNSNIEIDYRSLQKPRGQSSNLYFYTATQAELKYSLENEIPASNVSANPDTIFFSATKAFKKKVPVVVDRDIRFRPGFRQYNFPVITPDSIYVTGPEFLRDSVNFIKTATIVALDADKSIETKTELINPWSNRSVTLSETDVKVTLQIEEFTEATIELPISLDCPQLNEKYSDARILLFPEKVTVHYLVALKDIPAINPSMFGSKVFCPDSLLQNNNRLPVEINEHPGLVEIIRLRPSEVEYVWITH
jgi:YbbR domain-containing protein